MIRLFTICATAFAMLSGVASAQSISRQIPVDSSFADAEFSWQGMPGGYEYRIKLIDANGIIELCGVGVYTNAQLRQTVDRLLRGAQLKINGRTVIRGFRYFNRVNHPSQLNRAVANCKSTGVRVPRGEIDIDIDWPDGTFRN